MLRLFAARCKAGYSPSYFLSAAAGKVPFGRGVLMRIPTAVMPRKL
jgi:hypothetical protein